MTNVHTHGTERSGSRSVLLIEADAAHRDLLRLVLEREGYEVKGTGDPAYAELLLNRACFDCVVLEMLLPGMNSLRLIRRIRENTDIHQPDFILMSSLGFREVVEKVAELRVAGFLKKPVDPADLLERLESIGGKSAGGCGGGMHGGD